MALSLPYRLRLGVTGHRAIRDPEAISRAVQRLLDDLEKRLAPGHHVRLEWTIVSPLAKGADHLVAEAVLSHDPDERHPELEVITPLPLEEYRTDFDTPADLAEFEALLERASARDELASGVSSPRDPAIRNLCYLEVGKAVVRACEILIAVWDGHPAKGEGGTAAVVAYAVGQGRIVVWLSADDPSREPVLLLPQRRWLLAPHRGRPFRTAPMPTRPKSLSLGLHQLAAFLRDGAASPERLREAARGERRRLQEAASRAAVPDSCLDPVLQRIVPYFVRADMLAVAYQTKHTKALGAMLYLAAIAVSAVAFGALFLPQSKAPTVIEILAMLGVLGLLATNRKQAWHEKWVHDRYLAEHLRTAIHSLVAGEDPSTPVLGIAHQLPFYTGPKSWLRWAIREVIHPACEQVDASLESLRKFVVEAWLMDQSRWHRRNSAKKERSSSRRRQLVLCLFGATLAMAGLHLVGTGHGHQEARFTSIERWYTFFAIALPAWATAIHAVGKQLEYERVAARSSQMASVLEQLALSAEQAKSVEELRALVREAIEVVVLENHEWSVLLSFAPPELAG